MLVRGEATLVTPQDLATETVRERFPARDLRALERTRDWVRSYLCNDHPGLGRRGPVCPYVEGALKRGLLWMTTARSLERQSIMRRVFAYRDWFLTLPPTEPPAALWKTILIVFPELPAEAADEHVNELQKQLKPGFVGDGLMIGQFYEGCMEPGLWNGDFHPLQSPLPLLAIRHMVPSDFPFLRGNPTYLRPYFERFAGGIPERVRTVIVDELVTAHNGERG